MSFSVPQRVVFIVSFVVSASLTSVACSGESASVTVSEVVPTVSGPPGAPEEKKNIPKSDDGQKPEVGDAGASDAAKPSASGDCKKNGAKALAIAPNHTTPHVMEDLGPEDFGGNRTETFEIGGGAHTHSFTLTSAQRAELVSKGTLTVVTNAGGNDGHTHTLTLGCK